MGDFFCQEKSFLVSYLAFLDRYKRILAVSFTLATFGMGVLAFKSLNSFQSNGQFENSALESSRTDKLFATRFVSPDPDILLFLSSGVYGWSVHDQDYRVEYFALKKKIQTILPIISINSFFELPSESSGTISKDQRKCLVSIRFQQAATISLATYDEIVAGSKLTALWSGTQLANEEVNAQLKNDLSAIEKGAAPVLIVILVFTFGGLVAALIPIFLTIWTLLWTLASLYLITFRFRVTNYALNVVTIMGAGLAVDFSLFLHIRFLESLEDPSINKNHQRIVKCVSETLRTSGRTVAFSALTLSATLSGALQFHEYFIATMALTVLLAGIFAAIGSLTVVPTIYLLLGESIYLGSTKPVTDFFLRLFVGTIRCLGRCVSFGLRKGRGKDNSPGSSRILHSPPHDNTPQPVSSAAEPRRELQNNKEARTPNTQSKTTEFVENQCGMWFHIVSVPMKYPITCCFAILVGLTGLAVEFYTKVQFGVTTADNVPLQSRVRTAIDTIQADFPSQSSSLDIFLQTTSQNGVRDAAFLSTLYGLTRTLEGIKHVTSVLGLTSIQPSYNLTDYQSIYSDPFSPKNKNFTAYIFKPLFLTNFNDITRLVVTVDFTPTSSLGPRVVSNVRAAVNSAFRNNLLEKGTTGFLAFQTDTIGDLRDTLPKFLAVLFSSMFFFLLLLTGSVVLPLKAVVTAVLTVSASFGVLVLTIQENAAASVLGFKCKGTLDPEQLIFVFAVSFALSLDYEIFLLGRIQEIYIATKNNTYAVATGIESSARGVTLAATLLCVVLGAFLHSKVLVLQEIGIGIGFTIFFDATIVRSILLPAVMKLFGDNNWYAPAMIKAFTQYMALGEGMQDHSKANCNHNDNAPVVSEGKSQDVEQGKPSHPIILSLSQEVNDP